jgi:hypothetical protein
MFSRVGQFGLLASGREMGPDSAAKIRSRVRFSWAVISWAVFSRVVLLLSLSCGLLGASPLNAQALPSPPQTFSILESSEKSEPSPLPPESPSDLGFVAPPDDQRAAETPAMPEDEHRFDNLFLELPSHEIPEPISPIELEKLGTFGESHDVLPSSESDVATIPTMATDLGYAVLLAGPVHEALLMRTELSVDGLEPIFVTQSPPAAVLERPADSGNANSLPSVPKFEGNPKLAESSVKWIAGYWSWLEAAQRYVWVSGVYRAAPPGREWIAGSWTETNDGHRWRNGYWAEASKSKVAQQLRNLPTTPPPAIRGESPSLPPPTADSFWIRGYWMLANLGTGGAKGNSVELTSEAAYSWQAGYWATRSPEWIWQPAHFAETDAGFVFVTGYWDFEPQYRGQAFACVVFDEMPATGVNYQPLYPLSRPAATLLHLFAKEGLRNYFYGDYYDQRHLDSGYQAWYELVQTDSAATETSPLLSFYRWKYARVGIDLVASMQRFADHFRAAPSIRPAAQIAASPKLVEREGLAGQVNADTYDAIVRGSVGQQTVVRLATGSPPAVVSASATATPSTASQPRSTPASRPWQRPSASRFRQR